MASLSWSEIKKYQHRVDKFLSMIDGGIPFELSSGSKTVLMFDSSNEAVAKFEKEVRRRGTNVVSAPSPALIDSKGNAYAWSKLKKTVDFGSVGENKGNVAEGILAAAMAARFLSKTKSITVNDVNKIIKKFPRTGRADLKTITLRSPNSNPEVVDELNVVVELNEADMKNFLNKTYNDLLRSATAYVNQANVKKWADLLYNNDLFNIINVKSMGISGQTATKVDTWLEVGDAKSNPERVDVNISLKAGDVKQFGQEAGMKFEAQERLWTNFGVSFTPAVEKKFVSLVSKKEFEQAFKLTFGEAEKQLSKNNVDSKKVATAIVHYATLNESNVDLLQLKGNVAIQYQFSKAVELISPLKLNVSLTYGASKLPTLTFVAEGYGPLVRIRVKKSGVGYFRSIIEKEKAMSTILATRFE